MALQSSTTTPLDSFSVATWNIWFVNQFAKSRYVALVDELMSKNPDIIAFHETHEGFFSKLKKLQFTN